MKTITVLALLLLLAGSARSQTLKLPERANDAVSGSEFAKMITPLDARAREQKIYEQVALGNVPNFLRDLAAVRVQDIKDYKTNAATYYVTPDYLAVGSDDDYFFTPLTPIMAQKVADLLHCSLPTRKMVDDIYRTAAVKLVPSPIQPSAAMTTVPIFIQHNTIVSGQRKAQLAAHPLGALVAGDKKDVVISAKLADASGRVAIYGWHQANGKAIQPLYIGHAETWADYSHGIRLVQMTLGVNGTSDTVSHVLADPKLCDLLSDEGPIATPRYPADFGARLVTKPAAATAGTKTAAAVASAQPSAIKTVALADFQNGPFGEKIISYSVAPEVKIHINAPATFNSNRKVKLIFYGLPNGNTIDQTVGRTLKASGDNWHFNIQHIGAQTRFLREVLSNDCSVVVVYLEAGKKSWPAWRKDHADLPGFFPMLVDSVKSTFKDYSVSVTLSGHSGGGSLIFGYINAVDKIPDDVERIAFLDSNYAYDPAQGHAVKLMDWLKSSDQHYLSVLAYNDAVALLNGTNFVSANGGTWGRSHAMLKDMQGLNFTQGIKRVEASEGLRATEPAPADNAILQKAVIGLEMFTALNGRVEFLLKENLEKKIYHTVQVGEKNVGSSKVCFPGRSHLKGKATNILAMRPTRNGYRTNEAPTGEPQFHLHRGTLPVICFRLF